MSQNPGTLDATGDISTETKQDDIITELQKSTTRLGFPFVLPFVNPTFGADFALANAGFSGTPEIIHDGTDLTAWTATNLVGSNFVFNSTTHAKQGVVTVLIFSNLTGDTITIQGTNITNTVLTEGIDWTAATDNATTATSIAGAIDGVAGVSATSSGAVVTVIADDTITQADITALFTDAAGADMTATARSIDGSNAVNDDEALFTAPSPIDFSNFATLTLASYVIDWSTQGGAKEVEIRFRNNGVDVGNSVELSTFINIGSFNIWQSSSISKTTFGIDTETVDELVIKVVDEGAGTPPSVFFDLIQIEETGTPVEYSLNVPPGLKFIPRVVNIVIRVAANGVTSRDNLPGDLFYNLPALAIGLGSKTTFNGVTGTEQTFRTMDEQLTIPDSEILSVSTNVAQTEVEIHVETRIREALELKSSTADTITQVVNDDFTPFIYCRLSAGGVAAIE